MLTSLFSGVFGRFIEGLSCYKCHVIGKECNIAGVLSLTWKIQSY